MNNTQSVKSTQKNKDAEPNLSPDLEALMKADIRAHRPFSPETLETYKQFNADHEAWEVRMANKGRGYKPQYIKDLVRHSESQLMDWLKNNGAPDEILTLAEFIPEGKLITYVYFSRWMNMPPYFATELGHLVPAAARAVKALKSK
jgi:hypothetical protein